MSNLGLYNKTSPYYDTNVIGNKYLNILNFRPVPMDPDDVSMAVTVVYQYRPDLLAFDLYGDSKLWWVFAARNPNRLGEDPYFNFVTGLQIFVPKLETLKRALGI